jgi:hypothetical protein
MIRVAAEGARRRLPRTAECSAATEPRCQIRDTFVEIQAIASSVARVQQMLFTVSCWPQAAFLRGGKCRPLLAMLPRPVGIAFATWATASGKHGICGVFSAAARLRPPHAAT